MRFFDKRCGESIETWGQFESWEELEIEEWLFYKDDSYFGKVTALEENCIFLNMQHFRVTNASYIAQVRSLEKVLRPQKWIWTDPQIQEHFPQIYQALEKAFRIWRKIEEYILNVPKNQRNTITPMIFQEIGSAFGNWSAHGYINEHQLQHLQKMDIVALMSNVRPLDELVEDDSISEEILEQIDILRSLPYEEAKKQSHFCKWLVIQSGFFSATK